MDIKSLTNSKFKKENFYLKFIINNFLIKKY